MHDIHVKANDHIPPAALAAKVAAAAAGPLRIAYVGRADTMKGPFDWIEVLEKLDAAKVDFRAVWLGDGEHRAAMRQRVERGSLRGRVEMPGFAADRQAVLSALREAQVFLFCHKTPESPRCLIEALVSACPIVGYEGAFARDLVAGHGGGQLVARNDVPALAAALTGLAADRARLGELIAKAAADGAPYTDTAVFRHRSELIRRYLAG